MTLEQSVVAMAWYGVAAAAAQWSGIISLTVRPHNRTGARLAAYGTLAAALWALAFLGALMGGRA